jgi:hypothetical protein
VNFSSFQEFPVLGIFAFPRVRGLNLIYGFGCDTSIKRALEKSRKEFLTRLGFLWGEVVSMNPVERSTSLFHQEFYLDMANSKIIYEWINGTSKNNRPINKYSIGDITFVNHTPAPWSEKFSVMRAHSNDSIPLFFGKPPKSFDFPFRHDIPHPMV